MTTAGTVLEIRGSDYMLNGQVTYTPEAGFEGADPSLRGKLMMLKTANCIFDDARYPEWGSRENPYFGYVHWDYPDAPWDPDRHTDEFIAALPAYRDLGILMVNVNLMGNQPTGRAGSHPWINSAYTPTGDLKPAYRARLGRVLDAVDAQGMAIMVGLFYPQQDQNVMVQDTVAKDDALIRACIESAVGFLVDSGHRNILVEIGNESNHPLYDHWMLRGSRVYEAIDIARAACDGRFPVATSTYAVDDMSDEALGAMDYLILHTPKGQPELAAGQVRRAHERAGGTKPVMIKEDTSIFCMTACLENDGGFGLYHQGVNNYREGFQSVPVNWAVNTVAKWQYLYQVARLAGRPLPERPADLDDAPPTGIVGLAEGAALDDLYTDDLREITIRAEVADEWPQDPPLYPQRVEYLIDGYPVKYARPPEFTLRGEDLLNGPMGFDIRALPAGEHVLLAVPYYIDRWIETPGPHTGAFRDRTGQVATVRFTR